MESATNITIINLMYDNNRIKFFEAAYSYLSAPIVVGLSKGRLMSPFERLIKPFKYIIWICLISSLLLAILLIFIFKYYSNTVVQSFIFGAKNLTPFTNF